MLRVIGCFTLANWLHRGDRVEDSGGFPGFISNLSVASVNEEAERWVVSISILAILLLSCSLSTLADLVARLVGLRRLSALALRAW